LYNQAVRSKRQAQALLSIVQVRSSDASLEEIIQVTIDAAYQLLLPERVSLFLIDHVKNELWIGVSKDGLEGITLPLGSGLAGYAAVTGQTINVPDAYADPRFNRNIDVQTGYKTKTVLCAPVPGFGDALDDLQKPLAVIQLINKVDNRPFDKDDEEALQVFCQEVSTALRRKLLETTLLKVVTDARMKPAEVWESTYLGSTLTSCLLSLPARFSRRRYFRSTDHMQMARSTAHKSW
jgi:GAF domain-containing protein